ncbi:unnamed protein product [Blepharisma stoltei]|uniref:Uncharacterized protein n=1 Tax=Blepharisma stoltei TaxID=1481888 RepID=A0AAU9K3F8_9CILI|nr:unnamed protein product [Blepharisma stoltei]
MESDHTLERSYKINAMQVLHREISQLETQSSNAFKSLKLEKNRLEKLSSKLQLIKQQIEHYTQEIHRVSEGIKDANWKFTKEVCHDLSKIKNPNPLISNICEKFMIVLDQQDRSWKAFLRTVKHYNPLKSLMCSVNPEIFSKELIADLMPILKHQQSIQQKLHKTHKSVSVLAEWISYSVEYKIKKDTFASYKKKLPSIEKKLKSQVEIIAEINALILTLEEQIAEAKLSIEQSKLNEEDTEEHKSSFDWSWSTTKINNISSKILDEKTINFAPLHKGTASGGILRSSFLEKKKLQREFPDFNLKSEELYVENPKSFSIDKGTNLDLEGASELLGCYRSRFFCF